MQTIKTDKWTHTEQGEARGYIDTHQLRELWFHTGTACNLQCPFCLEGSKPGDERLNRISLDDIKPFVTQACELGVEQFSFTGGEPFVVRALIDILAYAAQYRPCLVLTNGTDALLNRLQQIKTLNTAHPISFRISIDYPELERHEHGRGAGTFIQAWQSLNALHQLGFSISIARQMEKAEDAERVTDAYRGLMREYELPEDTHIVPFPDFLPPGAHAEVPQITEHCMRTYQDEQSRRQFMCATSRMVVKQNKQMRVYACTLVDDDPDYDQGTNLAQALHVRTMLKHHRCYSCFSCGSSCSELS